MPKIQMHSNKFFIILALALSFFSIESNAQSDDISFLLSKIKGAYAGYQDKDNDKMFDNYVKKILRQETDTFLILSKVVSYFNDPHLRVFDVYGSNAVKIDSIENKKTLKYTLEYLADIRIKKDAKEGFYYNEKRSTVWAIIKSPRVPLQYNIVLIESKSKALPHGFITGYITAGNKGQLYTEYRNPYGGRLYLKSKYKNDSILIIGELTKLRKVKRSNTIPKIDTFELSRVTTAGKLLDKDNYLFSIPDFSADNIPVIDSIIKRDYEIISNTKNLIIDIRGNSGGTVRAYDPLQRFVYTNPIVTPGGYTYCSPDLLQQNEERLARFKAQNPIDSSMLVAIEKQIQKIANNIGKFLYESGDTLRMDSVLIYPKNVAIIANYSCESAAELMILDYKQSKKVTVFGENTAGGVDFLDAYSFEFPSKKYTLNLATVKRSITAEQPKLDGIGIRPDVKIPDSCKDWPGFVKLYYEKR